MFSCIIKGYWTDIGDNWHSLAKNALANSCIFTANSYQYSPISVQYLLYYIAKTFFLLINTNFESSLFQILTQNDDTASRVKECNIGNRIMLPVTQDGVVEGYEKL